MPNLYNYSFCEDSQFYYFITKNNIEYRVAFIIDETFSAVSGLEINNIFQIIIEKANFDETEKLDILVSATIKVIISSFFENSQNSIIYVCDDKDKKSQKRFNVFNRWYQKSGLIKTITKVDNIIICQTENENFSIYSSLLYHQDNQNKDTILEVYNTIQEILNDK
ncbi:hypothetical protein GON26_00670 [Flavobacterium sp. GA093]|uniref:Uncharacterized protein n=1 Tax=Flavobacterium hydrocarbonoxydans TaxID=2683249 RepID=A0A6I4NMJ2_9FLAO|nr:DUF6169 family protein [Flavobacterium hydrocarbonoxydans]MWB92869.1 hypothetical protein [Flavobacterium hydrocarbonoxydans]